MEFGHWLDDGSSCTTSELLEMVRRDLEDMDETDPEYEYTKELEHDLIDELAREE